MNDTEDEQVQRIREMSRATRRMMELVKRGATYTDLYILHFGRSEDRERVMRRLFPEEPEG